VKGAILTVRNLKTWFPMRGGILQRISGYLKAVDDVSFDVLEGETLGLVGESGAGKTTVANTLLRLVPHHDGKAYFKDTEIFSAKGRDLRNLRRSMQIIFQDPYASLDPRQTQISSRVQRRAETEDRRGKGSGTRSCLHVPRRTHILPRRLRTSLGP